MLQDFGVALSVDESQCGSTAPNIVPVGGSVPVVPMPVFVFDSRIDVGDCFVIGRGFVQKRTGDDPCERFVAFGVQVDAV